ncbi:MAG TPA: flagellar filament capping protein FliD [Kofleriaceae bacterium]|nr:flagellar filament capping protein FliD [Kofleriaceae bacterium]
MPISFSGLASGLDSAALIDQLVSAEKSTANTLSSRQSDLNTQKSIVNSLSSLLSSLGTIARGMTTASALDPHRATSSDAKVSVAASAGATATTHSIRVNQRASAQVSASVALPSQGAGAAGAGSLDITVAGTTKSIAWTNSDSLSTIASKINDAKAGATASVLFDGSKYQIVMTASKSGTANAPTFSETGPLGFSDGANIKLPAKDAKVNVDGIDIVRSTNVIDDAIAGLTITLAGEHAVADTASAVAVSLDTDALATKVESFVSAYNAINSSLHVQLDYNGAKKGTNTLFGDSTLLRLQSALASTMGSEYGGTTIPGSGTTLGALGISRDKTGAMTLDKAKLAAALAADPKSVQKHFVDGGFAKKTQSLLEDYTRTSDGALAAKTKSLESRHKAYQTQIDRINTRAEKMRAQLESQFTAMEAALSKMQSQSAYLSKFL